MEIIGAQGEVRVYKIDAIPAGLDPARERDAAGAYIISHSESGHHHVIGGDVDVMERTRDVPAGMRIIYAIVRNPSSLRQSAATPHKSIPLAPGLYELRVAREYDPFAEQARRVAD